jgi:DNA-binding FrmR family transcriptional regulator
LATDETGGKRTESVWGSKCRPKKQYTIPGIDGDRFGHTIREKAKLLNRVRRVRGQIEAVERAREEEKGCTDVLHLLVASPGAMNGLMVEIIEDHIRMHVVDPARERNSSRARGELIEVVQASLK